MKLVCDILENEKLGISDDALVYCGLKNSDEKFDLGVHLLKCMEEFYQNNDTKRPNMS